MKVFIGPLSRSLLFSDNLSANQREIADEKPKKSIDKFGRKKNKRSSSFLFTSIPKNKRGLFNPTWFTLSVVYDHGELLLVCVSSLYLAREIILVDAKRKGNI